MNNSNDNKQGKQYNDDFNPFHTEFLKWNNPPSIIGTVHYHFKGYQDGNLKLVSQQFRDWLGCTDVQAGLALYWWQKLITFGVGRIKVKGFSPPNRHYKELKTIDNLKINVDYLTCLRNRFRLCVLCCRIEHGLEFRCGTISRSDRLRQSAQNQNLFPF